MGVGATDAPMKPGLLSAAGQDRLAFVLMVAPALLFAAAFYFFPILQVLWISFTEPTPGLGNYAQLFTSTSIARVLSLRTVPLLPAMVTKSPTR